MNINIPRIFRDPIIAFDIMRYGFSDNNSIDGETGQHNYAW